MTAIVRERIPLAQATRIAEWEPAHRDRINALLNGGAE